MYQPDSFRIYFLEHEKFGKDGQVKRARVPVQSRIFAFQVCALQQRDQLVIEDESRIVRLSFLVGDSQFQHAPVQEEEVILCLHHLCIAVILKDRHHQLDTPFIRPDGSRIILFQCE